MVTEFNVCNSIRLAMENTQIAIYNSYGPDKEIIYRRVIEDLHFHRLDYKSYSDKWGCVYRSLKQLLIK